MSKQSKTVAMKWVDMMVEAEPVGRFGWRKLSALWLTVLLVSAGCQTQTTPIASADTTQVIGLREGDTLKISFPGAPNLNTTQQIRTDGNIELPLGGELRVVGLTADELQKDLIKRYDTQLVSKEVTVTIDSASFPIYVTGAVLRPGKILSNHPMSALEALMEAGGADATKANLKAVTVTRYVGDKVQHFELNLKSVLQGEQGKPFYLMPADIVTVPEKFSWF